REGDQLRHAHPGLVLDSDEVEVVPSGIAAGLQNRPMLPGLDHIAHRLPRGPGPGQSSSRQISFISRHWRSNEAALRALTEASGRAESPQKTDVPVEFGDGPA